MPDGTVPIVFKVIEPVTGFYERRTVPADRIGKTHTVVGSAIANLLPLIGNCQPVALNGKYLNRLSYILEILRSETSISESNFLLYLVVSLTRDANATSRRDPFETGSNIDAVSIQVIALNDDIAEMHTDAKCHLALDSRSRAARCHFTLNFSRTSDPLDNTRKLRKQTVAHQLHCAAAMLRDRRLDHFGAMLMQQGECSSLVFAHHSAIAGRICG